MAFQGPHRRQFSTELGLFGDLLDESGGLGGHGKGVGIQPNPDLGISGADRGGCLFSALGPTLAWRLPSLPGTAYLRNSEKGCPLLWGLVAVLCCLGRQ